MAKKQDILNVRFIYLSFSVSASSGKIELNGKKSMSCPSLANLKEDCRYASYYLLKAIFVSIDHESKIQLK